MAASMLLEAAQNLTPDRHANFQAGLYGAGGALAAALLAELFTRVWKWRTPLKTVKLAGALAVVAFAVVSLVAWELRQHTGASEMGPPGPLVPPVRPAPPPADRTTRCDQMTCGANCMENEQILNAYAFDPGGVISFIDQRNVSFRPKENRQPTALVLA